MRGPPRATPSGCSSAHCDSALAALDGERSPEIPVGVAVIRDVRTRVEDLAAQLDALGSACSDYADHVDAKRSELRSLLEDLAVEIGITAVLGGLGTLFTGGAAAGAAGGVGAARLAAAGTRARGILDSLRVLTGGTALGVRPVAVTAGEIGVRTERINAARVMLTEAGARCTRVRSMRQRPGWLPATRDALAVTRLGEHVAQSNANLMRADPARKETSLDVLRPELGRSARSRTSLRRSEGKIRAWLDGPGQRDSRLDGRHGLSDRPTRWTRQATRQV